MTAGAESLGRRLQKGKQWVQETLGRRRSSQKQGQSEPKTSLTYRDERKPKNLRSSVGVLELHEQQLQRTPLSPSSVGAEHLLKEDQVSALAAVEAFGPTLDP